MAVVTAQYDAILNSFGISANYVSEGTSSVSDM